MNGQNDDSTDADLVRAVQAGDATALSTLYQRHVVPVYRFVRRRVATTETAEDVVSETFLAVVEHIGRFRFQASFRSWLFMIARRRIADHWRRRYRLPETAIEPVLWLLAAPADPPADMGATGSAERLRPLLGRLPERDRRVLECRFFEERSIAETAETLGLTEGNVKVIQHRAIKKLAQLAHNL